MKLNAQLLLNHVTQLNYFDWLYIERRAIFIDSHWLTKLRPGKFSKQKQFSFFRESEMKNLESYKKKNQCKQRLWFLHY